MAKKQPRDDDTQLHQELMERFGPRSLGVTAPDRPPAVIPETSDVCYVPVGKQIDDALYFIAVCRRPKRRTSRRGSSRSSRPRNPTPGRAGKREPPDEPIAL